jgi:hypothetical protein
MNRIQQLSQLAREYTIRNTEYTENTYPILEKKFADLILQDVEQLIDELYLSVPLDQQIILLALIDKINSHFK